MSRNLVLHKHDSAPSTRLHLSRSTYLVHTYNYGMVDIDGYSVLPVSEFPVGTMRHQELALSVRETSCTWAREVRTTEVKKPWATSLRQAFLFERQMKTSS